MAQIDSSIYSQRQDPDVLGKLVDGYQKGMTMRQMLDEKKKKKGIDDAYAAGVVTNPDGTKSIDKEKTMSSLVQAGAPDQALEFGAKSVANEANNLKLQQDKLQQTAEFMSGALNVKDETGYQQLLGEAKKRGLDTSSMDTNWGPGAKQKIDFYAGQVFTAKERFDQQYKKDQLVSDKAKQTKADGYREREIAAAEKAAGVKAQREATSGEHLPIDKKKFVESLSTKNANKAGIKNQIDAVMKNWDGLSKDQKVAQGRSLLKTLNSTEGADAIGVEEANRLGSKLEFAMGNFTNSNPTQFGRDLEGFKVQADTAAKNIGSAIVSNQAEIDRTMGRQKEINPQDSAAVKWAKENPKDPRSAKILELNGIVAGK